MKFWLYLDIVANVIHQVCKHVSDFVVSYVRIPAFGTMKGMGEAKFFTAWAHSLRVLRFPGVAKCFSIKELSLREIKTTFL